MPDKYQWYWAEGSSYTLPFSFFFRVKNNKNILKSLWSILQKNLFKSLIETYGLSIYDSVEEIKDYLITNNLVAIGEETAEDLSVTHLPLGKCATLKDIIKIVIPQKIVIEKCSITLISVAPNCIGCREEQPNQEAHYGGCIRESYLMSNDEI